MLLLPLTLLFQSKANHSSPSSGHRPQVASKNITPSRGVFHAAMEDAPSDDEDSSAPALTLKPAPKGVSPARKEPTPPPHAQPKGSSASTKPQPQHSANKKIIQASKVPVLNESDATHATSELKPALAVTAVADDSADEDAALASDAALSTHHPAPTEVIVENSPSQLESEAALVPLASASVLSDDSLKIGSPRPASQEFESVAAVSTLKPVPTAKSIVTLKGLPMTARINSSGADSISAVLPVITRAPLQLTEPDNAEVADTVRVDLQCFAVTRRQVESFCNSDDVPLPPELAQLQPSSDLASKINAGKCCLLPFLLL
jgi:hypothetical protein